MIFSKYPKLLVTCLMILWKQYVVAFSPSKSFKLVDNMFVEKMQLALLKRAEVSLQLACSVASSVVSRC